MYSIQYYPRFHVTMVGLKTYYPWIWGHHCTKAYKNVSCCLVPETERYIWHNRSNAFLFPYLKSAVSKKKGNYCTYAHTKSSSTQELNKPKPTGSVSPAFLTAGWQTDNRSKQEHRPNRRTTTNIVDIKHTLMTEALHSWSRCFLNFLNLQLSSPVI
jgi:hypothetical protein